MPQAANRKETVTKVTRIPVSMHAYLKTLGFYKYETFGRMYESALIHFLWERPWEEGMRWHKTQAGDGFKQVHVTIPKEVASLIDEVCQREAVSRGSFLYTGLFWFAWYIWTPQTTLPREWEAYYQGCPSELLDNLKGGDEQGSGQSVG